MSMLRAYSFLCPHSQSRSFTPSLTVQTSKVCQSGCCASVPEHDLHHATEPSSSQRSRYVDLSFSSSAMPRREIALLMIEQMIR